MKMSRLVLKSSAEIEIMDQANSIVRRILDEMEALVKPGISTMDLDRFAERRIR